MFKPVQPRHRFLRIYSQLRQTETYETDDPVEEAVVRLLLGDMNVPEEVLRAYGIFWDKYKREVVEAFILAEAKPKDIHAIFRIKEEIVEIYQQIFFDTSVFYDRLDAESYARNYSEDSFGHDLKVSAIEDGLEYLKARFGRGHYNVSPVKAVRELISQSYVNSKIGTKVPLESPKAKEARMWASTMTKSIESLSGAEEIEGSKKSSYVLKLELMQEEGDPSETDDAPETVDPKDIVHRRTEE